MRNGVAAAVPGWRASPLVSCGGLARCCRYVSSFLASFSYGWQWHSASRVGIVDGLQWVRCSRCEESPVAGSLVCEPVRMVNDVDAMRPGDDVSITSFGSSSWCLRWFTLLPLPEIWSSVACGLEAKSRRSPCRWRLWALSCCFSGEQ